MGVRTPFNLLLLGTAGSGKTQACSALLQAAGSAGIDAAAVNLDPGVSTLPYQPDIDVRNWIDMQALMTEQGYGPNGAQIAAADLMALKLPKVVELLDTNGAELNIIDTPGQMELFSFRPSSIHVLDHLGRERTMLAFLHDASVCRDPRNLVSDMLLASAAQLRLGAPSVHLLSKADLLPEEGRATVISWLEDVDALRDALTGPEDDASFGYARMMAASLDDAIGGWGLVPFSSSEGLGTEELLRLVSNVAGWDDEESVEPADGK